LLDFVVACVEIMSTLHNCTENKCTGQSFEGEYLRCSFCCETIFIECLNKCNEASELLNKLGYVDEHGQPVLVNSEIIVKRLKKYFSIKSALGLTCVTCREYFKTTKTQLDDEVSKNSALKRDIESKKNEIQRLSNELDDFKKEIDRLSSESSVNSSEKKSEKKGEQSTSNVNESDNDSNLTQKTSPKTSVSPKPIVIPKEDENGLFIFYLAKSDKEVTTDSIVAYILEEFKMNTDAFKVVALPSMRKHRKTYTAFKVTVFTKENCELLCKTDIWTSDYRVRPFDKVKNRRDKLDKQRTDKRQEKVKPNPSVKSTKPNKNNNNNNNNRSNEKPRNSNQRNNNQRHKNNRSDGNSQRMPRNSTHRTNDNRHSSRCQHHHQNHCHENSSGSNEQCGYEQQRYQQVPQQFYSAPFWYPPPQFPPPIQQQGIPVFHPQQYQTFAPPQVFQPVNYRHQN